MSEQVLGEVTKRRHTKPYERVTVRATISSLGNQDPAFHITLDTEYGRGGWQVRVCGCQHDEVRRWFPELTQYVKWHGFHVNRGVWYYVENPAYWAGFRGYKPEDEKAFDYFKSNIMWGAVDTDDNFDLEAWWKVRSETTMLDLLSERLPALFDAFDADMTELFGDDYLAVPRFRIGTKVQIVGDDEVVNGVIESYVVNGYQHKHFVVKRDDETFWRNPEQMTVVNDDNK